MENAVSEVDKADQRVDKANVAVKEACERLDRARESIKELRNDEKATDEEKGGANLYFTECIDECRVAKKGLEIAQIGFKDALSRIPQQIQGESATPFFMFFFFLLYCIRVRGFFW